MSSEERAKLSKGLEDRTAEKERERGEAATVVSARLAWSGGIHWSERHRAPLSAPVWRLWREQASEPGRSSRSDSRNPSGTILAADGNARRFVRIGFVQREDHIDADRKFPADPVMEGFAAIVR